MNFFRETHDSSTQNQHAAFYLCHLMNKASVLTSGKVIKLISRIPRAEARSFRRRGIEEGSPCGVEHDHLFQLGVVIHGGVREAQVV